MVADYQRVWHALPLMRAGSIKAYAVTSDARLPLAPDIPTFGEMGLPGLSYSGWFALFAPQRRTNAHHKQAQRGGRGGIGRSGGAISACLSGAGHFFARTTDTRGTRRTCESGCREMVADYQRVWDQGGMRKCFPAGVLSAPRVAVPLVALFVRLLVAGP